MINQRYNANEIRYGIYLAKKNNKLGNVKQIDILFKSGVLETISRKEIKGLKLGQKFKGR
ncbi:MAG: hypothetical protein JXL97_04170 [Bacteroidales bacterium]|nr:hypothetical protein [Bacteroidales bacterium]